MRFTNGFNAALVDRVFFRARFWRLEKSAPHPCQGQRDQWKGQRHANEDNNEQIRIWIHEGPIKFARKESLPSLYFRDVNKTVRKFRNLAEAEKADREFYKKLSGNERLQLLLQLLNHAPEQRLERVSRITKLARR